MVTIDAEPNPIFVCEKSSVAAPVDFENLDVVGAVQHGALSRVQQLLAQSQSPKTGKFYSSDWLKSRKNAVFH